MASAKPWISPQAYARLQKELATLRELREERARATADLDDEHAAVTEHDWRARARRIHDLLDLLRDVTVGENPPDDGIAEPGMVLTIRYDDTGDIETFLLGVRGAEYDAIEVYSHRSPLGAAIAGARPGERRTYALPSGGSLTVTLLEAVPYGRHMADSA